MALILAALHHGQGTQPNLCAVCSFIGDRSSLSKGNALGKIKYKTLKNVGTMLWMFMDLKLARVVFRA